MQLAWKLGVVALIALAFTVLPGGGGALRVVGALLSIVFLSALAFNIFVCNKDLGFQNDLISYNAHDLIGYHFLLGRSGQGKKQ